MAAGTVKTLRLFPLLIVLYIFSINHYQLVLSSESIVPTTISSPRPANSHSAVLSGCSIRSTNGSYQLQLCHFNPPNTSMPTEYTCICGQEFTQPYHLSRHEKACEDVEEQTREAYKSRKRRGGRLLKRKRLDDDDDLNRAAEPSARQTQRQATSSSEHPASSSYVSYITYECKHNN